MGSPLPWDCPVPLPWAQLFLPEAELSLLLLRMEQGLEPQGCTGGTTTALISHLHRYKGFISQSDFIFCPESERKLTGVWVVFEEINSHCHPSSLL